MRIYKIIEYRCEYCFVFYIYSWWLQKNWLVDCLFIILLPNVYSFYIIYNIHTKNATDITKIKLYALDLTNPLLMSSYIFLISVHKPFFCSMYVFYMHIGVCVYSERDNLPLYKSKFKICWSKKFVISPIRVHFRGALSYIARLFIYLYFIGFVFY